MKIAIVGPESSGKSSLSKALSERLSISWVPEFARAYLDGLGRAYTEHDLIEIAKGQLALEDAFDEGEPQLLICDTNILVILIWAKDKFGRISPELKALWDPEPYALHLLLKPDLPWEPDPLREDADRRDEIFDLYRTFLKEENINFSIIQGTGEARTDHAIYAIHVLIKGHG